jgi:hypothetical protein
MSSDRNRKYYLTPADQATEEGQSGMILGIQNCCSNDQLFFNPDTKVRQCCPEPLQEVAGVRFCEAFQDPGRRPTLRPGRPSMALLRISLY